MTSRNRFHEATHQAAKEAWNERHLRNAAAVGHRREIEGICTPQLFFTMLDNHFTTADSDSVPEGRCDDCEEVLSKFC